MMIILPKTVHRKLNKGMKKIKFKINTEEGIMMI